MLQALLPCVCVMLRVSGATRSGRRGRLLTDPVWQLAAGRGVSAAPAAAAVALSHCICYVFACPWLAQALAGVVLIVSLYDNATLESV